MKLTNAMIERAMAEHEAWKKSFLAPSRGFFKPVTPDPDELHPTQFDRIVEDIGVSPQFYEYSGILREWCKRNRNHRYVPEWLLAKWGLSVTCEP